MDSNSNTLLDLIRQEQARRQALSKAPEAVVLFRWGKTDDEWAAEIEEKRRSGEIGPHTRVIPYVWDGPPFPKKLV